MTPGAEPGPDGTTLRLDGGSTTLPGPAGDSLATALGRAGRTLPIGCGEGWCGTCTVEVDGEPVLACLTPAGRCQGADVRTARAAGDDDLRRTLVQSGAVQCGYCTAGVIVVLRSLLAGAAGVALDPADVRRALVGNLCRCTGYEAMIEATMAAAVARARDGIGRA